MDDTGLPPEDEVVAAKAGVATRAVATTVEKRMVIGT